MKTPPSERVQLTQAPPNHHLANAQPAQLAYPAQVQQQYRVQEDANIQRAIISVEEIFGYIRRFWIIATLIGLCAGIGIFAYLQSRKPIYESTAIILLNQSTGKDLNLQTMKPATQSEYNLPQLVNNMSIELSSDKFRLSFYQKMSPELRAQIIGEKAAEEEGVSEELLVLERLSEQINIELIKDSHMVSITAKHEDNTTAAMLANEYVKHFITFASDQELVKTRKVSEFLKSQAHKLLAQVKTMEAELEKVRSREGIVSMQTGTDLATDKVNDLNGQLITSRIAKERLENMISLIDQVGGDAEARLKIPALAENTVLSTAYATLASARSNVAMLSIDYGRKHPRMLVAVSQEKLALENLGKLVKQTVASLKHELTTTSAKVKNLEMKIDTAMNGIVATNNKSMSQQLKEQQVKDARELYSSLVKQMNEASIELQFAGVDRVRITEQAIVQREPLFPRTSLSAVLSTAAFGSCFLGIPLGFGLGGRFLSYASSASEKKDEPVPMEGLGVQETPMTNLVQYTPATSPEDLAGSYPVGKYPTLAELPGMHSQAPPEWVHNVTSPSLECGRDLANLVSRLTRYGNRQRGVIVTSDESNPLKQLSAAALAMSASRLGLTTMLISCQNATPSLRSYSDHNQGDASDNAQFKPVDELLAPFTTDEKGIYHMTDEAWVKTPGLCVDALCNAHQCVDLVVLDAPLISSEMDLKMIAPFASTCVLVRNESEDCDFPGLQAKFLRALPNCRVAGEFLIK